MGRQGVPTVIREEAPDEYCPRCGAVYRVQTTYLAVAADGVVRCVCCSCTLRIWNGTTSYRYTLKLSGPGL
jgi:predicted Zn finger-like uncharacterized protein